MFDIDVSIIQLTNLKKIYLGNVDDRPIAYLTQIEEMCICDIPEFDYADLQNLINLTDLRIYDCDNESIKYDNILSLTNLTKLYLKDAEHLSHKKLKYYLPNLKKINLESD